VANNRLYLAWSGAGPRKRLQWTSTADGVYWGIKQNVQERSQHAPALVHFRGEFYLAWTGTDSEHHINIIKGKVLQDAIERTYIPWISPDGIIAGGGENPLLRGGILMASFAVEYLVRGEPSSLAYSRLLLDYFEKSEVVLASGERRTGFFLRCRNALDSELEFHASGDEIVGLVLGLYYLYLATEKGHPDTADRVRKIMRRLGENLKSNAYLLIPPSGDILRPGNGEMYPLHQEIHKGSSGLFFFQYALEVAFKRVTGYSYRSDIGDYHSTTRRLWHMFESKRGRSFDGPCILDVGNQLLIAWSGRGAQRRLQIRLTSDGGYWYP